MKCHLAIVGSLLLSLPVGASELEQLRESNRQQAAKIRALEQEIRALKGGKDATAAPSASQQSAATSSAKTYTIRSGDTLSSVAKSHDTTVKALLAANPGIKPNRLRPGQTVQLPTAPKQETSAPVAPAPAPAPAPVAPAPIAPPAAAPSSPAAAAAPADTAPASAPARSGIVRVMIENVTTAGEFAARHQTSLQRLNELNGLDLTEASILAKGSELLCPAP